jgi:hypothetical protein
MPRFRPCASKYCSCLPSSSVLGTDRGSTFPPVAASSPGSMPSAPSSISGSEMSIFHAGFRFKLRLLPLVRRPSSSAIRAAICSGVRLLFVSSAILWILSFLALLRWCGARRRRGSEFHRVSPPQRNRIQVLVWRNLPIENVLIVCAALESASPQSPRPAGGRVLALPFEL